MSGARPARYEEWSATCDTLHAHTQVLGQYVLDWEDVGASPDPHASALAFARAASRHPCAVCEWDPARAASAEGTPPPIA